MTIDTSAALGTIQQVLAGGQYPNVELGVAPMPGPKGKGGVLVGGARQLHREEVVAREAGGGVAVREVPRTSRRRRPTGASGPGTSRSVSRRPTCRRCSSAGPRYPGFKVAYDQLVGGVTNTATAGPVIGDYQGVRDVVLDSEQQMFNGMSPSAALKQAKQDANAKIEEYNSRVGASRLGRAIGIAPPRTRTICAHAVCV